MLTAIRSLNVFIINKGYRRALYGTMQDIPWRGAALW